MKRIKTLATRDLKESMKKGGCGECQTSCQSACKTNRAEILFLGCIFMRFVYQVVPQALWSPVPA